MARRNATLAISFAIDLGIVFTIFCALIVFADVPPFTTLGSFALFIGCLAVFLGLHRALSLPTPGRRLWDAGSLFSLNRAISLTLVTALLSGLSGAFALLNHPLWLGAERWRMEAFLPPAEGKEPGWRILPFFYSLGAWPSSFGGRPIHYSIPYEKGPPHRFLGHVNARWDSGEIRVSFEGPKTPEGREIGRAAIESCLVAPEPGAEAAAGLGWFACARLRQAILIRHIEEIRRISPRNWSLRWFRVENPALDRAEQAQGIFLGAANDARGQDRFILITERGTHQAVLFDYTRDQRGQEARRIFQNSIRSLRVSDTLEPGRAWIDRMLESIQLPAAGAGTANGLDLSQLAVIQSVLAAKVSVEPGSFEAFYHLGGTTSLLTRVARAQRKDEWGLTAQPVVQTIQSAQLYARDIAPDDRRTQLLLNLWIEAKQSFL